MQTTTLTAHGITCGGCANGVKNALRTVPGVADVQVDVARKQVTVTHDEHVNRADVVNAVKKAGFQPA